MYDANTSKLFAVRGEIPVRHRWRPGCSGRKVFLPDRRKRDVRRTAGTNRRIFELIDLAVG